MDTPPKPLSEASRAQVSIRKPLIVLALPFVLFLPTWWFFCRYVPEHSALSSRMGVEHMRVHWGVFWVLSFFPFSAICFLTSVVMLVRRARYSPEARLALVPACLCVLGVLVLLFLIFTD